MFFTHLNLGMPERIAELEVARRCIRGFGNLTIRPADMEEVKWFKANQNIPTGAGRTGALSPGDHPQDVTADAEQYQCLFGL